MPGWREPSALTLRLVSTDDPGTRGDEDRTVDLSDDVLPSQTADDTDRGWGEWSGGGNDDWLLAERPPHWE
ncbi:hypothetical protein GA0070620_3696 [Micromonospora krabiensis]|uniref:Uncharacterized protein n=1 Tax=Micromonospora krabiensis TaxID=307121 RepID=A0A1C3N6E6_9ACTN|nr:hypothetical protein GA0070620_3696 [Micromonospora krabiensis]